MVKIAICDDIIEIVTWMEKAIADHRYRDEIQIDTFTTGWKLYESAARERYDIIFLDIELVPGKEDENGMQVSAKIKDVYPETLIIFFTGKMGYESALLNFEPFRYIQKPVKEKELVSVVKNAIDRIKGWEDKYYTFRWNGISGAVNLKRTILFLSRRPYIEVETIDEAFKFREKMDHVELEIAKISSDFLRAGKSYLINKAYVRSYTSREVVMENGERISLGRKYAKDFLERMK